jgi:hypothetical protein
VWAGGSPNSCPNGSPNGSPGNFLQVNDEFVWAAERLEETARAQARPFSLRLGLAWAAALAATVVLGVALWSILEAVLGWPTPIAATLAFVVQAAALGACHWWLHGVLGGDRPWSARALCPLALFVVMVAFSYLRAATYLEDFDLAPWAAPLFCFVLALVDPLITLATAALTAVAQHALERPRDLVWRAEQHRMATIGVRGDVWPRSIAQAEHEREVLLAVPVSDRQAIRRRDGEVEHLDRWLRLLHLFHPHA